MPGLLFFAGITGQTGYTENMKYFEFSRFHRGILNEMLMDAYSQAQQIVDRHKSDWQEFDNFVFNNLNFMDKCGFVSVENDEPIGFVSWDPRKLPDSMEIGHNCIIGKFKGKGYGSRQLGHALKTMAERKPSRILVKTGNTDFFMPARKMYQSAGFEDERIIKSDDPSVPEVVEFSLKLGC